MPDYRRERFDVHAVLQRHGREAVSEIMEAAKIADMQDLWYSMARKGLMKYGMSLLRQKDETR